MRVCKWSTNERIKFKHFNFAQAIQNENSNTHWQLHTQMFLYYIQKRLILGQKTNVYICNWRRTNERDDQIHIFLCISVFDESHVFNGRRRKSSTANRNKCSREIVETNVQKEDSQTICQIYFHHLWKYIHTHARTHAPTNPVKAILNVYWIKSVFILKLSNFSVYAIQFSRDGH